MSGSPAMRTLASALATQHARVAAWRSARLRATAAINAMRCSAGAPLYGADTLALLSGLAHPCSPALNAERVTVTDHTWVGPSLASFRIWHGHLAPNPPTGEGPPGPQGGSTEPEGHAARPGAGPGAGPGHEALRYHPRRLRPVQVPLHLPSLVLDVGTTYEARAWGMADLLRDFMFVIPRVSLCGREAGRLGSQGHGHA